MLIRQTITCSAAAGTAYSAPFQGLIEAIKVDYTSGDAGGDLTVTDDEQGTAIMTLTSNATDKAGPLRAQTIGITGANITDLYGRIPVSGRVKAVWADHAAGTTIVITLWIEEVR